MRKLFITIKTPNMIYVQKFNIFSKIQKYLLKLKKEKAFD